MNSAICTNTVELCVCVCAGFNDKFSTSQCVTMQRESAKQNKNTSDKNNKPCTYLCVTNKMY